MSYRLRYSQETRLALQTLPGFYRQRAKRVIEALVDDPYPRKSKQLRDADNLHRLRLGSWRILYHVDEGDQEIYIVTIREKIGPETYEDLS